MLGSLHALGSIGALFDTGGFHGELAGGWHVPQFCESDEFSVRRVGCVGQGRLSLRTIIAAMVARPVSARLIRTHFVAGQNA
jgi:hypothetical protein